MTISPKKLPVYYKALNIAAILLVMTAVYFYALGMRNFIAILNTGSLGAWCVECFSGSENEQALQIVPGSPAYRAGIRNGDEILAVDGQNYETLEEIESISEEALFEGAPGEKTTLTIRQSDGTIADYELVRERGWNDISMTGLRVFKATDRTAFVVSLIIEALIFTGFSGTGVFIWLRRRNMLTFLTGFSLIFLIFPTTRSSLFLPLGAARTFMFAIGTASFYALFFLFPNGKFYPRFGPVIVALYGVWLLFNGFFLRPIIGGMDYSRLLDVIFWAVALRSQFQRYRNFSSPEQKQQIKWILAGLFFAVFERSIFLIMIFLVPDFMYQVSSTVLSHSFLSIGDLITRLLFLVIPMTFLFSILRYGLWDIDYVINRSIIYTTLSLILGVFFAGTLYIAQVLLKNYFSQQQIVTFSILSASVFSVGLMPRIQNNLRRWVDARLFGINLDYQKYKKPAVPELFEQQIAPQDAISGIKDIQLIGRGGMGEVYRGRKVDSNEQVAIKILPRHLADEKIAIRRFMREAQISSGLQHPNIVRTLDYGEYNGYPYIIMEYIRGITLESILLNHIQVPIKDTCKIIRDICSALTYAHDAGIVHRDLKPSNILIETDNVDDPFGGDYRCLLSDFGIAKMLDDTRYHSTTGIKGTFEYLSPEQITESPSMDSRVDIYSVGVVTYRLLTGQLPFNDSNMAKLLLAHLYQPPPPPTSISTVVPAHMETAVMKALEKDPDSRYSSIDLFQTAICGLA